MTRRNLAELGDAILQLWLCGAHQCVVDELSRAQPLIAAYLVAHLSKHLKARNRTVLAGQIACGAIGRPLTRAAVPA